MSIISQHKITTNAIPSWIRALKWPIALIMTNMRKYPSTTPLNAQNVKTKKNWITTLAQILLHLLIALNALMNLKLVCNVAPTILYKMAPVLIMSFKVLFLILIIVEFIRRVHNAAIVKRGIMCLKGSVLMYPPTLFRLIVRLMAL